MASSSRRKQESGPSSERGPSGLPSTVFGNVRRQAMLLSTSSGSDEGVGRQRADSHRMRRAAARPCSRSSRRLGTRSTAAGPPRCGTPGRCHSVDPAPVVLQVEKSLVGAVLGPPGLRELLRRPGRQVRAILPQPSWSLTGEELEPRYREPGHTGDGRQRLREVDAARRPGHRPDLSAVFLSWRRAGPWRPGQRIPRGRSPVRGGGGDQPLVVRSADDDHGPPESSALRCVRRCR